MTDVKQDNIRIEIIPKSETDYDSDFESDLGWEEACEQEASDEIDNSTNNTGNNYCYTCCTVINSMINPSARCCTCISEGNLPHTEYCPDCEFSWSPEEDDSPCDCILAERMHNAWEDKCVQEVNDEVNNYCNKCCAVLKTSVVPPARVCTCISEGKLPHTAYCGKCDVSWNPENMDCPCECTYGSRFGDMLESFQPYIEKLDHLYISSWLQSAWHKYNYSNQSQIIKEE